MRRVPQCSTTMARSASISPPPVSKRLSTAAMRRIGPEFSTRGAAIDARGRTATSSMLRVPAQQIAAYGPNSLIRQEAGEPDHDHAGDYDIGPRHLARVLDHR